VTQTTSRLNSGNTILNPRLRELLEKDELDWDDFRQRDAFLKYWINRPQKEEESADE
jgi:hypothetical protein